VFSVGANPHQLNAKQENLIFNRCTTKKQSDGAYCTTEKHFRFLDEKQRAEVAINSSDLRDKGCF
jgi:hypothetical protein